MSRPISDYTNYSYQSFWSDSKRDYEHLCETRMIRSLFRLIPGPLSTVLDIGGGFGRLSPSYAPFCEHPILLDFSLTLLESAAENPDLPENLSVVNANFYSLPFMSGVIDVAVTVRTLHHVADLAAFFSEVSRVIDQDGYFIFEVPNKRHILNIVRFLLGKCPHNPFSLTPYTRQETFINYHPRHVIQVAQEAGFDIVCSRNTSFFRSSLLKTLFPHRILAKFDTVLQSLLSRFWITPSVFFLCKKRA